MRVLLQVPFPLEPFNSAVPTGRLGRRCSGSSRPSSPRRPTSPSTFRAAAVLWTRQLTPSVVNEARIGFNRVVLEQDSGVDVGGVGDLGEALGMPDANENGPGLPAIAFAGAASGIGSSKVAQDFAVNTFQYQDSLTWHHGRHLVKTGILALRFQQNVYFSGNTGPSQASGRRVRGLR